MYTTYHLSSPTEITAELVEIIKKTFHNKSIVLTIEEELDATRYLISSAKNKSILDASIAQDQQGQHIKVKFNEL